MTSTTANDVAARAFRAVDFEPLPAAPGHEDRPLIPMKVSGSTMPVFMVHGGYGQVFQFKRLVERLREDIPFYGLEARGLRDGSEPQTSVPEMAASYIAAIRTVRPHGPYLIAGFSFGGWAAWEMARQLDAAGEDVHLLMVDIGATPLEAPSMSRARRMAAVARYHWRNWIGLRGKVRRAYFREAIKGEMMRVNGFLGLERTGFFYRLARKLGPEEPAGQLRIFSAALRAIENWELAPYPRQVTLFRADIQPAGSSNDERMNLSDELAPGGVDVRQIPGSHSFIYQPPHVNQMAVELEAWVDRQMAAEADNEDVAS
jgi:thioesterase domain-containing protein